MTDAANALTAQNANADRVCNAFEFFVKSLEAKLSGFRHTATVSLAFSAFLATAIIQYKVLDGRSIEFIGPFIGAFISAIVATGASTTMGNIVKEQAASITEQLAGVKLGFAGKIKTIDDAIDAYNHEIRYFNSFGPVVTAEALSFMAMTALSCISVLVYIYETGTLGF